MIARPPTPEWFEPRLPTPGECSIAGLLAERAGRDPEADFIVFDDGRRLAQGETFRMAQALAGRFRALGVRPGDRVAIWQPNGPAMVRALFACSLAGATASLLNVAFRGNMLARAIDTADAEVLFAHGDLVERLEGMALGPVKTILATEPFTLSRDDVAMMREEEAPAGPAPSEPTHPWDVAAIIFTSGTTGESKGVRVTAAQVWSIGQAYYGFLGAEDRMMLMLPLFHIAALGALYGAMSAGASLTITESFRPNEFWDVVRRTGATANIGLGAGLVSMLLRAPPSPDDRNHGMRRMLVTALDPVVRAFSERYGCDVYAGYGMSETSVIATSELNPAKDRSVGRIRKGIEARLVDEHDIEVEPGQPGELILRAALPWVLNDGYHKNPQATAEAWRNGWFHTGDILARDEDGDLFFVDRIKDAIRRRGENISSVELEAEIRGYPPVRNVAVVGVKVPEGEEVLAVIEPVDPAAFDPAALVNFLVERVAHYMIPRFVRVVDELPRTGTGKIRKPELRAEGLTPGCWDREAAGVKVRRQKLST